MYVLVLNHPGWANRPDDDNNYVKVTGFAVRGDSGNDGTPPDFQGVPSADGNSLVGWESSFEVSPGTYQAFMVYNYLVNVQVRGNKESDAFDGGHTQIVIDCTAPETPVPSPTPVPTASPTPTPSPSPTPTPAGSPSPTASPSPEPIAFTFSTVEPFTSSVAHAAAGGAPDGGRQGQ